jgi:hypothetical protein
MLPELADYSIIRRFGMTKENKKSCYFFKQ